MREYYVDIENCPPEEMDKAIEKFYVEMWQNFQTSLVLLIPNCTHNRMITYTYLQSVFTQSLGIKTTKKLAAMLMYLAFTSSDGARSQNLGGHLRVNTHFGGGGKIEFQEISPPHRCQNF